MTTVLINDRQFTVEATGLKNVAYKFHSGRLTLTGIRNQNDSDVIMVMDKSSRSVGVVRESTWKQQTAL